jgi:dTDP-4-amino-4,6-dideoxygalactose transaminase
MVIEDAAQAICSTYKGKPLGSIGHLAAVSFHETKNVMSGEGGALLINDPRLKERAEIIREKGTNRSQFFRGQVDKYTWVDVGSSYLPSELVAAFLLAQLEHAEAINEKRRAIWEAYHAAFEPLEALGKIRRPKRLQDRTANAHIYHLLFESLGARTEAIARLSAAGVNAVFHYVPLHTSPAGRRFARSHGSLPVTERVGDGLVRLPLWPAMSADDIQRVVDAVRETVSVPEKATA